MQEKLVSYLTMGVVLALVVNNSAAVSTAINKFAGGLGDIVTGIVTKRGA